MQDLPKCQNYYIGWTEAAESFTLWYEFQNNFIHWLSKNDMTQLSYGARELEKSGISHFERENHLNRKNIRCL